MNKSLIYLAGAISGCNYSGCTDWREHVAKELDSDNIMTLSPMRNKEMLAKETSMNPRGYEHPLTTPRGVIVRDHNDCTRADLLIVNLLDTTRVSIGTVMEVAWAWDHRIPMVCVIEPDNLHHHAMLSEALDYQTQDLDEAISLARAILGVT